MIYSCGPIVNEVVNEMLSRKYFSKKVKIYQGMHPSAYMHGDMSNEQRRSLIKNMILEFVSLLELSGNLLQEIALNEFLNQQKKKEMIIKLLKEKQLQHVLKRKPSLKYFPIKSLEKSFQFLQKYGLYASRLLLNDVFVAFIGYGEANCEAKWDALDKKCSEWKIIEEYGKSAIVRAMSTGGFWACINGGKLNQITKNIDNLIKEYGKPAIVRAMSTGGFWACINGGKINQITTNIDDLIKEYGKATIGKAMSTGGLWSCCLSSIRYDTFISRIKSFRYYLLKLYRREIDYGICRYVTEIIGICIGNNSFWSTISGTTESIWNNVMMNFKTLKNFHYQKSFESAISTNSCWFSLRSHDPSVFRMKIIDIKAGLLSIFPQVEKKNML